MKNTIPPKRTNVSTAQQEKELRAKLDSDPHDSWDRVPPTYRPPDMYQDEDKPGMFDDWADASMWVAIGIGAIIWLMLVLVAVTLIRG